MSVLLRAVAITLVVVTHADLFQLQGGAHVLLAVAGFNMARFQLAVPSRRERMRGLLRSACAVALPAVVFLGTLAAVGHQYRWPTALLLNGPLGRDRWDDQWQFWFLEALVWCYLGLAAVLAVPAVSRLQRAAPFTSALLVLAVALGVRYSWTGVEAGATERYTLGAVAWFVALGLCGAQARTWKQRLLVASVAVTATAGFFGDGRREAIVVGGVLLLVYGKPVRLPRWAASVAGLVASASLWIYLTHWQVYPPLEDGGHQVSAILASLVVGVVVSLAVRGWRRVPAAIGSRMRGGPDVPGGLEPEPQPSPQLRRVSACR
jgi:hypothetical protein